MPPNEDGYFTVLLNCKTLSRHVLSRIASVVIRRQMSFYLLFHCKSLILFVLRHCPGKTECHNLQHLQTGMLEANLQSERHSYFWWLRALSTQPQHAFELEKAAGSPAGPSCCFHKCFGEMKGLALMNTDQNLELFLLLKNSSLT